MAAKRLNLARARVLVSNDDGINAPGLKLLVGVLTPLVREIWVVAPETEQSATSHSLTLRRPLRVRQVSERRYAIDGTPTDSVLMAIRELMTDTPPDLLISGINRGGNVGEDVTYSGTVAAAMEGTLLGVPSMALSQLCADGHPVKWGHRSHSPGPAQNRQRSGQRHRSPGRALLLDRCATPRRTLPSRQ